MSVDWKSEYKHKLQDPKSALKNIRPGARIFIGTGCAVPSLLVETLETVATKLKDTEIMHILTVGATPYTNEQFCDNFRCNLFFIGENTRAAIADGRADYTPVLLSDLPQLFKSGGIHIDVALIQVTPPDERGFCCFGISLDIVKAATESAKMVIADARMAYTGSANITGAGVGIKSERKRNFEVGVFIEDRQTVERMIQYFDAIWYGDFCEECFYRRFTSPEYRRCEYERFPCPGIEKL